MREAPIEKLRIGRERKRIVRQSVKCFHTSGFPVVVAPKIQLSCPVAWTRSSSFQSMHRLEVLSVAPVIAWEIAAFHNTLPCSFAVRPWDDSASGSAKRHRCRVCGLCFEVLFKLDM